jgi:plastocyanin
MTRLVAAAVAVVLLAVASAGAATKTVRIERDGFHPATITVTLDDTVLWRNGDTVRHQVVADSGVFASPILRPGATWSYTFHSVGRFAYHDGLAPAKHGVVVVKAPPAAVSVTASTPAVTFGGSVTLTGSVSNRRSGEVVELLAQPYGSAAPVSLGLVRTTTGGAFQFSAAPTIQTTYTAHWRTATSAPTGVAVRPKVTFRRTRASARHRFLTHVTAAKSFAGHWVYLQRRNRFFQWVSVRKITLGPKSGRIFTIRKAGRYRIFLTVNQAGAGYLASTSGTQRVRPR